MTNLQNIDRLISENKLEEAISALDEALTQSPNEATLYFVRGKLHWRMGHRAQAITDYETAAQIDPTSPAVAALQMSRDVMNYFNPDLLNP